MEKKRGVTALLLVCVLALAMFGVWKSRQTEPVEGMKTVTVEVTHSDGNEKTFTYETEEEYLGALLEDKGLISGTESAYGLFVDTVDGETADYGRDGAWWRLTEEGRDAAAGVDEVILRDGGHYGWIYTAG